MNLIKTSRLVILSAGVAVALAAPTTFGHECDCDCDGHETVRLTPTPRPDYIWQPRIGKVRETESSGEGCYAVEYNTGGYPHAERYDEFCIGEDDDGWWLEPGAGMENWSPSKIRLTRLGNSSHFRFDVTIDPHPGPPPHGKDHQNFQLLLLPMIGEARIIAIGAAGSSLHGGTAHSIQL